MQTDLKKDYLWNSLGNIAVNFVSPLLLVAVTRINGLADYGAFTFCFSWAVTFFMIGQYGGRIYQVSDTAGEFESRVYIFLKFITAFATIVVCALFILFGNTSPEYNFMLAMLVLYKTADAIADPIYGVLQRRGRLYIAGMSMTLKAALGFTAFVAVDILTKNMVLASFCLLLANIVFILTWDIPKMNKVEPVRGILSVNLRTAFTLLGKTFFIFSYAMFATLLVSIPKYIMKDACTEEELGVFGIIAMAANIVALFVTMAIQPKLVPLSEIWAAKRYAEFDSIIKKYVLISLVFGAVCVAAAYFFAAPVLNLLLKNVDLFPYRGALAVCILGGVAGAVVMLCFNVLSIMRHLPVQLFICAAGTVVVTIAGFVLIPKGGSGGAAWAFLCADALQAVLYWASYRYYFKKRSELKDAV